ncbi:hypothetical protein DSL92_05320 [Billgrantia gudaonensis]|uniref:Uncharacterized protein n=1 Tax=Billgrantia gudaonensis TaxID=376427 RepID=A0A3S0NES6_9GAMM|nr:hypothetical protein DSL92_05320 [Halomonas gudaonensis]
MPDLRRYPGISISVTVKQDISARKEQEDQLRLMATAFETGQATLITDARMRIERALSRRSPAIAPMR